MYLFQKAKCKGSASIASKTAKSSNNQTEQQLRLRLLKAEAEKAELDIICIREKIKNLQLRNRMLQLDLEKKEKNKSKGMMKTQNKREEKNEFLNLEASTQPQSTGSNNSIIAQAFNESNTTLAHDILHESPSVAIRSVEPGTVTESDTIPTNMDEGNDGQIDNLVIVQDLENPLLWHTKKC